MTTLTITIDADGKQQTRTISTASSALSWPVPFGSRVSRLTTDGPIELQLPVDESIFLELEMVGKHRKIRTLEKELDRLKGPNAPQS